MNPFLLSLLFGGGLAGGYAGARALNSSGFQASSAPATTALTPITAGTSADYFENQLLGRVEAATPTAVNSTPSSPSGPSQSDINTTMGIMALTGGITSAFNAKTQQNTYEAQADSWRHQAATAGLNVEASKRNLYRVAQNYEYQAMLQGLKDRATIGRARVRAASSGTRMGTGSTAEVLASKTMNAKMNQIAISRNRTSAMNNARSQIASARAAQLIAQGNAAAADALAGGVSPFLSFIQGASMSFAMSDMSWQQGGFNTPTTGGFI